MQADVQIGRNLRGEVSSPLSLKGGLCSGGFGPLRLPDRFAMGLIRTACFTYRLNPGLVCPPRFALRGYLRRFGGFAL
jgi:hypothetical protein